MFRNIGECDHPHFEAVVVAVELALKEEPQANLTRYDHLRTGVSNVD